MNFEKAIEALFDEQLQNWEMASENYTGLQYIKVKELQFDEFKVLAQCNPKRIISSSAKVDPLSISERPCFLCNHNRPAQQKSIPFMNDYHILVNPFPIFQRHLTISSVLHMPQRITGHFSAMLQLARELTGFTIIYNGPNCGASAPDHFHFQGIPQSILPVESELSVVLETTNQITVKGIRVTGWDSYPRKLITLAGTDPDSIGEIFKTLFRLIGDSLPSADEPMMNILAQYKLNQWMVYIFPRRQHRPRQYFETGDKQLLVSPASIDMGGMLVIPRQEDFNRITKNDAEDIFNQVCVDDFFIQDIQLKMRQVYGQF